MKKRSFTAVLPVCAMLCGCLSGGNDAGTAAALQNTETSARYYEDLGERGSTIQYSFPEGLDGMRYYSGDARETEGARVYDYAYGYEASGEYDDSDISPAHFGLEGREYLSKKEFSVPKLFEISAGQKYADMTVRSATTGLRECDDASKLPYLDSMSVELEGTHELTGCLYYSGEHTAGGGNIRFIPAEGLKGLPLPAAAVPGNFFSPGYGIRSEFPEGFFVGDLFSGTVSGNGTAGYSAGRIGESAADKLSGMFGGQTDCCFKKVRLTVSGITMNWTNSEGFTGSYVIAEDIEEM